MLVPVITLLVLSAQAEGATPDAAVAPVVRVEVDAGVPLVVDAMGLPKSDAPEYAQEELSLGWALVRTVLMLGAVVVLAYLTLNVGLRRLLGIRAPVPGQQIVSVLERIPLDQKRALFVVRAANEVLLIGGSEASLELIAKLDGAEVEKVRAASAPGLQLSPLLEKLLGKKAPTPEVEGKPK